MATERHSCVYLYLTCLVILGIVTTTNAGSCGNGKKDGSGGCKCNPCFTGKYCDQIENRPPYFDKEIQTETVDVDEFSKHELVYVAYADDEDTEEICHNKPNCPCGDIVYGIVSGNEKGLFTIDPRLGIIHLNDSQTIPNLETHELVLYARNDFEDSQESRMTLLVKLVNKHNKLWSDSYSAEINNGYDGVYQSDSSHNIVKRAVTDTPANTSFSLTKSAQHASITTISPGQRISFRLEIDFPAGETDMLVELFAPDNNTIVMMLCDVKVESVGSNLAMTGSTDVKLESQNNSLFYDWAVIDFGNVTNNNNANGEHQIVITYDAVMIENSNTVNLATYWVSAGAEYAQLSEIWIGQASFIADIVSQWDANANKPVFNLTGPSSMAIGSSAVFTLEMYITYPSIGLTFDAFAPLNASDVMSICGIQIEGVGVNYECGFDHTAVPASLHSDGQPRGNPRARLDIGTVTNKGVRDANNNMADNLIKIDFVVKVWDDTTAVIGSKHFLGGALELGLEQIWCGQMEVEIVAKATNDISPNTAFSTSYVGSITEVSVQQPVVFDIDVDVSQLSGGAFSLVITAPDDGSSNALLQICSLVFISSGENLPCIDDTIKAVYTSQWNDKTINDRAELDLGVVTNVGNWGYHNGSLNDTRNTMKFRVLVKGAESAPTFNSQANFGVLIGLKSGVAVTPTTKVTLTITRATTSALPEIVDTPPMNLTFKYSDGNVRVGQAVTMFYEIGTLPSQTFPMFDMEFIAPNSSGSAVVSICRAEVIKIGNNIPCLSKAAIDAKWNYVSQFGDNLNDRAVLSLPSICNHPVEANSTEDSLILAAVFQLQNHVEAIAGATLHLSAGSMYTTAKMWVGQMPTNVDGTPYPLVTGGDVPQIFVEKVGEFSVTPATPTPRGYPATYEIIIKTVPGTTVDLKVTVSTTAATLGFCSLRIKDVGYNMPCVSKTIESDITPVASGLNTPAVLKIGPVTNVGDDTSDVGNKTFDANTLLLEVTMQTKNDVANGNIPFSVKVDLTAAGGGPVATTHNLVSTDVMTGISTDVSNASTIDFTVGAIADGDDNYEVSLGQVKRMYIDIFTNGNASTTAVPKITVKMMSSVNSFGQFEMVYIGLLDAGANLGCLSRELVTSTFTPRAGSPYQDTATLELGYVCNSGINTVDVDANRIRVEAYARLLNNDTLADGDKVLLNAGINFNDQEIFISQKEFTVKAAFTDIMFSNVSLTNATAIQMNSTTTPIDMKIGEIAVIPVVVYVPPNTIAKTQFDVDLPIDGSAVMTVKMVEVKGAGRNLCRFGYSEDYKITPFSNQSTSQINKMYVDLGIVNNIALTQRLGTHTSNDDIIYIEVTVQMTDAQNNINNAELWMGLGAKIASFIVITKHKFTVDRLGTEKPAFNVTATYDYSNSTSTYAEIDVQLDHATDSTAEFQNTIVKLNFPPYLTYKVISYINPATQTHTVNTLEQNGVEIVFGTFFFTDSVTMTIALDVNSTYEVPVGIGTNAGVTGIEVVANVIERNDPSFVNGTQDHTSGLLAVNGSYTTTQASAGSSCTPGIIPVLNTCQFTSSGDDISLPINAEYVSGTGWEPPVRDGKLGKLRYLQYDFIKRVSLTKIDYKHTKGVDYISKLQIRYSDDSKSWTDAAEVTLGPADADVPVNAALKFRYIRLYIADTSTEKTIVGLNVQFTGCYVSPPAPTGPVTCPPPTNHPLEYIRRSFVTDDTNVYVCDGTIGERNNIETRCFTSPDGNKWTAMDKRVSCMVGFDDHLTPTEKKVYAISNSFQYMTSDDKGQSWKVIKLSEYAKVNVTSTFTQAKKVPWHNNPSTIEFTQGNWQSKYEGLGTAGTFVNKFKWDKSCC